MNLGYALITLAYNSNQITLTEIYVRPLKIVVNIIRCRNILVITLNDLSLSSF